MGTVGSNVIFAIGATGASKAVGQFAMVGAAIVAIGKAISDVIGQAEEFRMVFDRLTDEQVRGVQAMDKASGGFIDTMGLMQAKVKMTEAGLAENNELMGAMARLVADTSRKMGEGPDAMLSRLNQLTDAISKGQTRALKQYGIDLDNTEDLLLAQAEATDKVIARASELSDIVGSENMREGFSRLNNDIDTTIGLMWGSVSGSDGLVPAFDAAHDAMAGINDMMMGDGRDAINEYIWSLQGMVDAVFSVASVFGIATEASQRFARNIATIQNTAAGKALGTGPASVFDTGGDSLSGSIFDPSAKITGAGSKGPRKRGGGGGKKAATHDMDFTDPNQLVIAEGAIEAFESLEAAKAEAQERAFLARLDSLSNYQMDKQTMLEQGWLHELRIEEERRAVEEERHAFRMNHLGIEETRRVTAFERQLGVEQAHIDQSNALWQSGVDGKAQIMGGFFGNLAKGMEIFGKKGWKLQQGLMIAEALAATASGAIKAYAAMAGLGPAGPALGALSAAAVTAYGMARVAEIRKLKPGSESMGGGGAPSFGGAPGGGNTVTGIGDTGGQPTVIVNVEGSLSQAIQAIDVEYTNKVKSGEWSGWGSEGS